MFICTDIKEPVDTKQMLFITKGAAGEVENDLFKDAENITHQLEKCGYDLVLRNTNGDILVASIIVSNLPSVTEELTGKEAKKCAKHDAKKFLKNNPELLKEGAKLSSYVFNVAMMTSVNNILNTIFDKEGDSDKGVVLGKCMYETRGK